MKRLLRTGRRGTSGHRHYLYYEDDLAQLLRAKVDPATGEFPEDLTIQFLTSIAKDHPHPVTVLLTDEIIAQVVNGQPVTVEVAMMVIEEADDHTHEIDNEITRSESTEVRIKQEDDHKIAGETSHLFTSAFRREEPSREEGALSEQFHISNQWIDNYQNEVELPLNRSKLTVNLLQPAIDLLLGHQRQNRTDIKYLPIEGSDELIADVLTAITKIELTNNDYEFEETQVIEDQLVTGRGNFIVYVDFDNNVFGDIKVERLPWRQVVYGEHNKYTAEDGGYIGSSEYFSKSEIVATWGGNDELDNQILSSLSVLEEPFERELKQDEVSTTGFGDFFDEVNKTFRVVESWKKEYAKIYSIVQLEDGFVSTADTKFSDISQLEQFGFKQIMRKKTFVRHQVIAGGGLLLMDEISDIDELPVVPIYYDKRGDKYWGKTSLGIDLQRFYNKLLSKVAEYVNKFVTSTHFYDSETFPNKDSAATEQTIAQELEQPGAMVEVNEITNVPIPMINGLLPAPVFNLLQDIRLLIQTTFNLNPAFFGESTPESGIKVLRDKQQALLGNEKFQDNIGLSKKRLAKLIAKNIANIYTPDRVVRLMSGNSVEGMEFTFQPGERRVQEGAFSEQELADIAARFADADLTKFDVAVAQSPNTPTTMIANYMMMVESMQTGQFPVPPEALIEINPFIDHRTKQRVLEFISKAREQQQQQVAAEQQSQQERTETAGQLDIVNTVVKETLKQGGKSN